MTKYKQLCAELIDALDSGIPSVRIRNSPLASRARAALAEPTDEQLLRTYALALTSVVDDAPKPWPDDLVNRAQIAGLRAVLARWGSHVLQPIPVTERLPRPLVDSEIAELVEWLDDHAYALDEHGARIVRRAVDLLKQLPPRPTAANP